MDGPQAQSMNIVGFGQPHMVQGVFLAQYLKLGGFHVKSECMTSENSQGLSTPGLHFWPATLDGCPFRNSLVP